MEMISGRLVEEVNPTCVGMDRFPSVQTLACPRKPHVRGDGPDTETGQAYRVTVNPTCVGMDRSGSSLASKLKSKPHVRGDGPPKYEGVQGCQQ